MQFQSRLALTLKVLPALLILGPALRAQSCSASGAVGTYSLTCNGFVQTTTNGPFIPTKAIGTIKNDITGAITGTGTVTLGGKILTESITGTSTVNTDCTGTLTAAQTLAGQPGPSLNLSFVLEPAGIADAMVTNPGTVVSCHLKKISK